LLDKVNFYLKNDEYRERIASEGQKKVLSHYTYRQQMKKIFDWITENGQE